MISRYLATGTTLCCALFSMALVPLPADAQNLTGVVKGRLLVRFRDNAPAHQVRQIMAAARAERIGEIAGTGVQILQLPAQASEVAMARAFGQQQEVLFAEPDGICAPDRTPNDTLYSSQWHLPKIKANTAWDTTTGSSGVIIAILDTGCDPTHPDLSSKYVSGWNTYDNNSDTRDIYGHGTSVAGSAAAASNNGSGVASVAWNCRIMPMRISDAQGYGYYSTVANALTWAADRGARVANISYAMSASSAVASAAQYFQSKGGVVTISAGNDGTFVSAADNPYVLTVSATASNDSLTSWSTRGNIIDVAAPGSGIYTTTNGGGYGSASGTSFSAPIVAGVAALVISANPTLTGAQVSNIVMQSADDLGNAGWDSSYGSGRVNALRAVSMALNTGTPPEPPPPPPLDTTAPSVSITSPTQGTSFSTSLTVKASATDNTGVTKVEFYVNGALKFTATSAPYSMTVNTRKWKSGTYTLTCKAYDAAGNTATSASVAVVK